jgi:hypothetical protein
MHIDPVKVLLSILRFRDKIFVSLVLFSTFGNLGSDTCLSFSFLLKTGTKIFKVLFSKIEAVFNFFFDLIRLEETLLSCFALKAADIALSSDRS